MVLFICFATKAITHLELTTNLTSTSFLASFQRFFSRQGIPSCIHSDNSMTFRGAHNHIDHFLALLPENLDVSRLLSSINVSWTFIPPRAPHFGGCREFGIRLFKFHLKRTIKSTVLALEQFTTLTSQIEATLNSRPLVPLSSSPDDFEALTLGHFLIGKPLTSLPVPIQCAEPANLQQSWTIHKKIFNRFWHFWQRNYLQNLQ